ncbi:hypothetical protein ADJ77_04855 [Prevotella fusca JCM 17724]|uniref:Uncharacterized protein n=3 Tax=Prevotella fusca TaxID=589436 RepID=A0A0K1NLC0_9BACT|nr:hypothetical protein ADJ77_04855 [Prevotella fusca JCM 17724]
MACGTGIENRPVMFCPEKSGTFQKRNTENNVKDFLNTNDRTSGLRLTDGEQLMLPCFSGESKTELYIVYFVGRTEKERSFWDVYSKNGFWKGKNNEQVHRYSKDMERYINARINQYDVFAIALNKRMVKDIREDEFLPDSNAVYKTYLLTNGKWIQTDSFRVQDVPKDTGRYLMNISCRRGKKSLEVLGDSLVSLLDFSDRVNCSCTSGREDCVLDCLRVDYFLLFSSARMPVMLLDAAHKLLFKKYKEKRKTTEHIKVYALLSVNNKVTDSVLCYEYYSNAENLSAYEQIFYIDTNQRKIWTVKLTYDVEGAGADAVKVCTIDLDRNCFVQENAIKNNPTDVLKNE